MHKRTAPQMIPHYTMLMNKSTLDYSRDCHAFLLLQDMHEAHSECSPTVLKLRR